ncbi:MAG: hypothetical protein ABIQ59_04795 [Nocardioidaceae bacterium]
MTRTTPPAPRHPSRLRSSISKTVGPRRGEPLTVTESADDSAVLAATLAVSALVGAAFWWRRATR